MAYDSASIASMTSMYQGIAMNQMAYAQQIGQQMPVYGGTSGVMGDRMMGSAMNSAASIGSAVSSAAPMIAGLGTMAMGGGFMASTGVGIPVAAGMAGLQYAGNQMYTGAQQQQALNQTLRGSFSFQNAYGGSGFTRSDMSQIGTQIRAMSEQFGPGGEIASFKELSALAGKMGQMGFAQGVRDVQEFGKRFKEMTTALKTMAKDLGTTLEGAMEFAQAAKGSGIFGTGRIQQFTSMARATSVSGNLALSEVTGAANIGAQISRSIGGLGRQGAAAGMRTIGQIGTAEQMGILSEEDIYNVTGQTGAEGRQAYAASSLQRTGSFLQSGRGRRVLASLADRDGQLDEEGVQQLLNGGMSISETIRRGNAMKRDVGRANFIRNEGRLRGATMERIGGFLPALQLKEWAQSKGIDINDMDDRSMLFAQRQLGMGRDEVDQAIKMVNNMPQILERQRRDRADDSYLQKLTQARKGQGIQGIEQRLDQARELVNGKLQKAGQDFFNQGSERIEAFFNNLSEQYVRTYGADIDSANRAVLGGGAGGRQAAARTFGIGAKMNQYMPVAQSLITSSSARDLSSSMNQGSLTTLESALHSGSMGETARYIFGGGQSDIGKFKDAGFLLSGLSSTGIQDKLSDIERVRTAAATGFNESQVAEGKKNESWIRDAYAMNLVAGEGDLRMNSFGEQLKTNNAKAYAGWEKMTQAQKAQYMANLERGAGIGQNQQLANRYKSPGILLNKDGFSSESEENAAYAKAVGQTSEGGDLNFGGSITSGMLDIFRGKFKEYTPKHVVSRDQEQAIGAYLKSSDGTNALYGLFSENNEASENTKKQIQDEIARRGDKDPVTGTLRDMLGVRTYLEEMQKSGGNLSPEQVKEIKRRTGKSIEELEKQAGGFGAALSENQKRDLEEGRRRGRDLGGKDLKTLASIGAYDAASGKLTESAAKDLTKAGGSALAYAQNALGITSRFASTGEVDQFEVDTQSSLLSSMTVAQKRAAASVLGGTEEGALAGRSASIQSGLEAASKKGARGSFYNTILGAGLSKDAIKSLDFGSAEAAEKSARKLAQGAGITDEALIGQIREAGIAGKAGKSGLAAEELRKVLDTPQFQEALKKKSTQSAEESDPLTAAVRDNTKRANDLLEALLKTTNISKEELRKLNVEGKDAEKPK